MSRNAEDRHPVEQQFETRRQFPRLKTDIPGTLSNGTGQSQAVRVADLSPDGAQIRQSSSMDNPVLSRSTSIDVLKTGTFILAFEVTTGTAPTPVQLRVRPAYLRTAEDGEIAAGVSFETGDEEALRAVRAFLAWEMQPTLDMMPPSEPHMNPGDATAAAGEEGPAAVDMQHGFSTVLAALARLQASLKHVEDRLAAIEEQLPRSDRPSG